MLEDFSDMLSLLVTSGFILAGIVLFSAISDRHHCQKRKKKEKVFLSFLEDMDDSFDSDDDRPFFG